MISSRGDSEVCSMLQTCPELRVVAEAGDGLEAVQKARELKPDLIMLDIGLPKLNGLEAANRIRQVASDAKIIFLTSNRDKDVVRAALNTGARGYVLKTDAGRELLTAWQGSLAGMILSVVESGRTRPVKSDNRCTLTDSNGCTIFQLPKPLPDRFAPAVVIRFRGLQTP